jgi:hypothetical protein
VSRLEIPLRHDILWATGDLLLRGEMVLHLRDSSGNWQRLTFRYDSGSDITAMPAWRAKGLGLPMPHTGLSLPVTTATGQVTMEVRSGLLRLKVEGMDQTEYLIPCHFRGDPDGPPDPSVPAAVLPRNLLGLSGVVDKLRITTDGKPVSASAPYGLLIIEKI